VKALLALGSMLPQRARDEIDRGRTHREHPGNGVFFFRFLGQMDTILSIRHALALRTKGRRWHAGPMSLRLRIAEFTEIETGRFSLNEMPGIFRLTTHHVIRSCGTNRKRRGSLFRRRTINDEDHPSADTR